MWTMAAPALAASIAAVAISAGVTGIAGCLPTVSAAPVSAQLIMTSRPMAAVLPFDRSGVVRGNCNPGRSIAELGRMRLGTRLHPPRQRGEQKRREVDRKLGQREIGPGEI